MTNSCNFYLISYRKSILFCMNIRNFLFINLIILLFRRSEISREKLHYAALLIQKHGRGYLARQKFQHLHDAATIIQKYARRFLVRINMLFHILFQIDHRNLHYYGKMATKIQACWRGYKVCYF